jgi:hypothetical protein
MFFCVWFQQKNERLGRCAIPKDNIQFIRYFDAIGRETIWSHKDDFINFSEV